jgi:hypothetical protein
LAYFSSCLGQFQACPEAFKNTLLSGSYQHELCAQYSIDPLRGARDVICTAGAKQSAKASNDGHTR